MTEFVVRPEDNGESPDHTWVLYEVCDGELLVIGWFVSKEDAEFVRGIYESAIGFFKKLKVIAESAAGGIPS